MFDTATLLTSTTAHDRDDNLCTITSYLVNDPDTGRIFTGHKILVHASRENLVHVPDAYHDEVWEDFISQVTLYSAIDRADDLYFNPQDTYVDPISGLGPCDRGTCSCC